MRGDSGENYTGTRTAERENLKTLIIAEEINRSWTGKRAKFNIRGPKMKKMLGEGGH